MPKGGGRASDLLPTGGGTRSEHTTDLYAGIEKPGIEKPDRMATLYDARGALFFNSQLNFIDRELCAVVKPHQKERSNAVFGNGNGVTEF